MLRMIFENTENTTFVLFENYSYSLNLIFFVLSIIVRTKKKKKKLATECVNLHRDPSIIADYSKDLQT